MRFKDIISIIVYVAIAQITYWALDLPLTSERIRFSFLIAFCIVILGTIRGQRRG